MAERGSSRRSSRPPIDREGLLAALILAPATYSRNQNFDLFRSTELMSVQRRARMVRSLLRLMLREGEKTIEVVPRPEEFVVTVKVPALGLTRTTRLSPLDFPYRSGEGLPADAFAAENDNAPITTQGCT